MFNFIRTALTKVYSSITTQLGALFGKHQVDNATLQELEKLLIAADTGVKTTRVIIAQLKKEHQQGHIASGAALKNALGNILKNILNNVPQTDQQTRVHLLVGINGSGKTTFAGKLAYHYAVQNKKVLLVAADTFRAAAPEQLAQWAKASGVAIQLGAPGQDPASVVFAGCERFKNEQFDHLIIDTAGRLQTKKNLMEELAKIKRIVTKQLQNEHTTTLLTIDSMLGQNSFEQAALFKECTQLDGIVLTKMDGTGKGGIVFGIAQELAIPVKYITFGEKITEIAPFNPNRYVEELLTL